MANQCITDVVIASKLPAPGLEIIPKPVAQSWIDEFAEGGIEDEHQPKIGNPGIFCSPGYYRRGHNLPYFWWELSPGVYLRNHSFVDCRSLFQQIRSVPFKSARYHFHFCHGSNPLLAGYLCRGIFVSP